MTKVQNGSLMPMHERRPDTGACMAGENALSRFMCRRQSRLDGILQDACTRNEFYMSRRKNRYERRQMRRNNKLRQINDSVGNLQDVFTYNDMYRCGKQCCNGVRWKHSVQTFELHLFSGTAKRRREVLDGAWEPGPYVHFMLSERGKTRPIDAPRIQDRQVHKVYTQKVLLPIYSPSLIYNNGASLPGKGFDFSKKELAKDLRWHYRRYKREGCIILIDFKKFFPTVPHDEIIHRHDRYILNDNLRKIGDDIVNSLPGKHGVPLGVEPSQAEMIAFPSALDNYLTCQLSLRCVGHYMDDYYIIVPPDRNPKEILQLFIKKAKSIGLHVNRSKSRIISLTRPFKYCKTKYFLTETGKVITRGNRDSMKRARRKIRMFRDKLARNEMTYEDLWVSVNGIIAYFSSYNDHRRVLKLRRLFYSIYGFSPERIENFRINGESKL